ncbi:MAG: hypothetical protein V1647_04530, partial [Pseudomonadota bacterium]
TLGSINVYDCLSKEDTPGTDRTPDIIEGTKRTYFINSLQDISQIDFRISAIEKARPFSYKDKPLTIEAKSRNVGIRLLIGIHKDNKRYSFTIDAGGNVNVGVTTFKNDNVIDVTNIRDINFFRNELKEKIAKDSYFKRIYETYTEFREFILMPEIPYEEVYPYINKWTRADAEKQNELIIQGSLTPNANSTERNIIDLLLREKGGLLKALIEYDLGSAEIAASSLMALPEVNDSDMALLNQIIKDSGIKIYSEKTEQAERIEALRRLEGYKKSDDLDIEIFSDTKTGPLYMQALIENAENEGNDGLKAMKIDDLIFLSAALSSPRNVAKMSAAAGFSLIALSYSSKVNDISREFETRVGKTIFNREEIIERARMEIARRDKIK